MSNLHFFIINDINADFLLGPTLSLLKQIGLVTVVCNSNFYSYSDISSYILSNTESEYIGVIRLGDNISNELFKHVPVFLNSGNHQLLVNYVIDHGFNSEPLKWSKRVLISKKQNFRYDGVQIIPQFGLIDNTELEVFYAIGVNLRMQRLRKYRFDFGVLISSQIQLMDEWYSIRMYEKSKELAIDILKKSNSEIVRDYTINQLAQIVLHDNNKNEFENIITQYRADLKRNPLVLADYFLLSNDIINAEQVLNQYQEPEEKIILENGVFWDRERYQAYFFYLLIQIMILKKVESSELINQLNLFYKYSIVLRNQIRIVKELSNIKIENKTQKNLSHAPDFVLVTHPRNGSTWIQQQLNSHQDLVCYGELLALNKPRYGCVNERNLGADILQRNENTIDFLSQFFEQPKSGFKLHLFQIEQYDDKNLWTWLLNNGNTKIIFLKRRDIIASYISFLLASSNHYWQTTSGDGKVIDTVTVNLKHFKTYLEKLSFWENTYISKINPESLLNIYYEDIVTNGLVEVEDFLGVNHQDLVAETLKQGLIPLEKIVDNLQEVVQYYNDDILYK
jgi:hypothetical protein